MHISSFGKFHFGILLTILLFSFQQISFTQSLLLPSSQTKFVNPLPIPAQINATNGGTFDMYMEETQQWLGLVDGVGNPLMTTVWGYGPSGAVTYPGPTFIAKKNVPVYVNWFNNLPGHFLPVDASLHMAHGEIPVGTTDKISWIRDWYTAGNVPTVAHLHGGHTESASDGLPEAWFTQGEAVKGDYFVKTNYVYDNTQEAATLWYHDHALGITRLNVYAGLAGFYLLEDNTERKLTVDGTLPKRKHDIEIVIQDRSFDANGQLFWPGNPTDPSVFFGAEEWNAYADFITTPLPQADFPGGGPTALAEMFGDFIVVNGVVWPYLDVEPRPYRFRLLNGSDSRFYILKFENGMEFLQIATDDGLLPTAVELTELLIAPGERAEIVVDFDVVGMNNSVVLQNIGPDSPFGGLPVDVEADPATTGQIMKFNVNKRLKAPKGLPIANVEEGTRLRPDLPNLTPNETRQLVLFEGSDEYGRLMPMLGTLAEGSLTWSDAITEYPMMNATEEWEVYNATGDAHPIHLHLVKFQIKNRETFNGTVADKTHTSHSGEDITGGLLSGTSLGGDARDPEDNEKGWKDTAVMLPGEVTRVIATFDLEGRYVWHCHILSHEDHEMMRPFEVVTSLPKQSGDVLASVTEFSLDQNYPNPFNPSTTINFSIPENTQVTLKIYDVLGKEVSTLINQVIPGGNHEVQFDATGLPSGVYFYNLTAGNFVENKKMMLMK
ncbi:MAG: multicopper oxidase domain-containing protein [Ignavibacteriaceae bacterium]